MEDLLAVKFHGKEIVTKNINTRIGWNGIKCIANKFMNTSDWYFKYNDEEGDSILGSTELEWQALTNIARNFKMLHVDIFTLEHEMSGLLLPELQSSDSGYVVVQNCCAEDSSCKVKKDDDGQCCKEVEVSEESVCRKKLNNINGLKCCKKVEVKESMYIQCCNKKPVGPICKKNSHSVCDTTSNCCSYQRPLPPDPTFDENEILIKTVNPLLPQYKYANEALRAVALPLGPLGGGSIAISGDGGMRQWQISNKVNHNAQVPDSFFAIKVGSDAAILQSNTWYDETGFKPSAYITDHVVPVESKVLLSKVPGVKTVEITAKYPVVEVDYSDDTKFKDIEVHLEAWNPKIPLNSTSSAIPVIIFDFHITNNKATPVEVSLLGSLQNIVGWNGMTPITNEVNFAGYGSNFNSLYTTSSLYGINMSNTKIAQNDAFCGNVLIAALTEPTDMMSTMLQYTDVSDLWSAFIGGTCLPGQGKPGVSAPTTTFNGAVSNTRKLAAGQSTVITYIIAWHFPNRIRDWNLFISIPNTPLWVGNKYAKVWPKIEDVVSYTETNLDNLRKLTYKFRDSMYNSTLPWQLIDSAAGRISVLNSPCCMWHHDGYFYGFEGCSNRSGCCPLNCTHVWNYEMALAYLYPDLERTMREIDLLFQISPHGVMPSRTSCPLELERLWNTWKNYAMDPASCLICIDGEIGTVFKMYREIKNGASKSWYTTLYQPMKLLMNHWLDVLDTEKNGLIYGPQPNTFDVATYGYMVIIGLLYLCGLRAAEEIAKLMGDESFETICRNRFILGSHNLDTVCFTNGKWYTHVVDPHHAVQVLTDCTFVGALYGQWWAHLLGLGYLLPKEHIISHLGYTYERNYVKSFDPATQAPRKFCDSRDDGWVMGKWDGPIPKNSLLYSREASWSGVIYPFASLMIMEGMKKEGLDVLEKTRYLYDGTRRSPWNEIECGDHYARPMSAYSLLHVASGQNWIISDSGAIHLSFKPTLNEEDFTGFFILGTCWGTYSQILNENGHHSAQISVDYGILSLDSITIHIPGTVTSLSIGMDIIPCKLSSKNDALCMSFASTVKVRTGEVLSIEIQ